MNWLNNLRLRPDLIIQPQDASCGTWVVKDPIALRFFLFGAHEYFILQRLDGSRSVEEILNEFAQECAPMQMTANRLHAFLSGLCHNGLTCNDTPGQSALLLERASKSRWQESVFNWTNLLAVRFPGLNPDAWLDRIYPLFRFCFSWWFMTCCLGVVLIALGIVFVHIESLQAQWPHVESFLQGDYLIGFAIALAGTKIFHEIAHAMTCKHFGGQCHELGILLLVFTPCLYCNVTDAWMLRYRWQRILISAAGILMELFLASLATVVWRYTQPGPLNSICLNVIVVCSLGTLLFNGNPLLKYDGYYLLSDLVRMPNLWQQARSQLTQYLSNLFLRNRQSSVECIKQRGFLVTYALASITYRCCLTLAIILFLYRLLHPSGLDLILLLVIVSKVSQMAFAWSTPLSRWWTDPRRGDRFKKIPLAMLITTLLAISILLFIVPLPCGLTAPAVMQPTNAQRIYIATPGRLVAHVSPGTPVVQGAFLAKLENGDLLNQRLRLGGELSRMRARVKSLLTRQNVESAAAPQLQVAQEIVADLTQQARLLDKELHSLILVAPRSGIVLSPPSIPTKGPATQELPTWTGTPLDPENYGSQLDRGTLFCLVGELENCNAVAFVEEGDLPFIRIGQRARLRLEHALAEVIQGQVIEIAQINAQGTPSELAVQHDMAIRKDPTGVAVPLRTSYQIRLELEPTKIPQLIGAARIAQIIVSPQTIGQRLIRWFRSTLKIDSPPGRV